MTSTSNHSDSGPELPGERAASLSDVSNQSAALTKIVSFETLARCGNEIWIENNGQIYRLRRTRRGKLILTK